MASERAEVRLLGTVEVSGPSGLAVLPGSRQRALVGLLALQPGVMVSRDSLIEALWGEEPPRTALKTLYSHVTRVRQALETCGLPDVLVTRGPGYALTAAPGEVDALRFEQLVRAGDIDSLRTALDLWRGDAFADAALAGWAAAEVDRLHDARLGAIEDLWEAELSSGRHSGATAALEPLVARHPYRERLVSLLMLARYREGRPTDALTAYQQLRTRLAEELGVDPGPALQQRYTAILRHDPSLDHAEPAVFPRPAQLPAAVGHFTGRTRELAALDQAAGRGNLIALSGPAGMGKTALALHWARQVEAQYPDGQLFLDLRGHEREQSMPAVEALPRLLRSLGVPADRVPPEVSEQAGLYRSLLNDKRTLVVLDNCGSIDQLLPLVPGGDGNLLLLTGRTQLAGLTAHYAVQLVSLDALDPDETLELLTAVLGSERVNAEPAATAELADLCGRMPLALRIAAANLAGQPSLRIAELVEDLATGDRLDTLTVEGDSRSVRTVLASAYRAVSPAAARLFRLLGLHPGDTFTLALASAAVESARPLLADLAAAQLITPTGPGRYRFHDLVRLFAAERARAEETPAEHDEVLERILDWYLAVAAAANASIAPHRNRVKPDLRYPPASLPTAGLQDEELLSYLDCERSNLVPLVRRAAESGLYRSSWQLGYLFASYLEVRGHWQDRIEVCRLAVEAARLDGDEFAQRITDASLGLAYNAGHQYEAAIEPLERSLQLARSAGDVRSEGNAYNNLGLAYQGLRRYEAAIDSFEQALELYVAAGLPQSRVLNNLGETYGRIGRFDQAVAQLERALRLDRQAGNVRHEAVVTSNMGLVQLERGHPAEAEQLLEQALVLHQRLGDRRYSAEAMTVLGAARLARGDHTGAIDILRRAVDEARSFDDRHLLSKALTRLAQALLESGNQAEAAIQLQLATDLRARIPDPGEEAQLRSLSIALSSAQ